MNTLKHTATQKHLKNQVILDQTYINYEKNLKALVLVVQFWANLYQLF